MRQQWSVYICILSMVMTTSLWALDVEPVAWWTFNEGTGTLVADWMAGRDGIASGEPTWIEGVWANALALDGEDDYVDLPIGDLLSGLGDATVAVWVNFSQDSGNWSRIWDFGSSTTVNWFLTPSMSSGGAMRVAITVGGNSTESTVTASDMLPTGWHHVAVTIDQATMTMRLLLDGEIEAEGSTHLRPMDLGATTQNWLGRSQYSGDSYLQADLDDLRIYDHALTSAEVTEVMADSRGASLSLAPTPVGWWTLDESDGAVAADDIQGRDGTVWGDATWIKGVWGHALSFDGSDDYVDLPIGTLLSTLSDVTICTWVDFAQSGGVWQRIWDFGSGTEMNWFLTPSTGTDGPMRVAITTGGSTQESQVTASEPLATGWHHVTVTIEASTLTMQLILDGELVSEGSTYLLPQDLGDTTQNWLARSQYSNDAYFTGSLDDLRVFDQVLSLSEITAVMANNSTETGPDPADGSENVPLDTVLSWPEEPEAVVYALYWGTSAVDVELASLDNPHDVRWAYPLTNATYCPESLMRQQTYYWRVDTVTMTGILKGRVWSFSTSTFQIIDDFEGYTDDMDANEAIFQTWIDGWGDPYNGAWVGYQDSPFAEQSIVYQGDQSMPLWYDNLDGFTWAELSWPDYWDWLLESGYEESEAIISEATRVFASPMDWTLNSTRYLILYLRGDQSNTGGQLYAVINDEVIAHPDPNVLVRPLWQQWMIDFNELSTDLTCVESLTIGVAGLDYGVVYIDEIGLYDALPDALETAGPGTEDLAVWYDMDGELSDRSGAGLEGQVSGEPGYVTGVQGQALSLDGSDDYVTLPIGEIVAQTQDMTLTSWVNFSGQGDSWQRIFDLGSGTSINMFLTPSNSSGLMRFAIRTASVGEQQLTAEEALPTGWHHVAVIIRGSTGTMVLYLDGNIVAEGATELAPMDLGVTTQNWLGRSQYASDPNFQGSIDEFRIYTTSLTELEIQYLVQGNL